MRKILIGVAVVAVVAIGAIVLLASNLDGLVKTAIEQVGTKVAGVPVTVSKVAISIKDGQGSIEGLTIANPKGFTTPSAISLGSISLKLDPATVTKSPVVIKSVAIAAPQISYEISGQGSNIDAIKKNVDAFVASSGGGKDKADKAAAPAKDNGTTLVIDTLTVTGGKVTLATPVPGAAATAALGDIALKDIGKSKGGASPADVATQLLDALSASAVKSASGLGLGAVTDALKDKAGGALDQVKGVFGK